MAAQVQNGVQTHDDATLDFQFVVVPCEVGIFLQGECAPDGAVADGGSDAGHRDVVDGMGAQVKPGAGSQCGAPGEFEVIAGPSEGHAVVEAQGTADGTVGKGGGALQDHVLVDPVAAHIQRGGISQGDLCGAVEVAAKGEFLAALHIEACIERAVAHGGILGHARGLGGKGFAGKVQRAAAHLEINGLGVEGRAEPDRIPALHQQLAAAAHHRGCSLEE